MMRKTYEIGSVSEKDRSRTYSHFWSFSLASEFIVANLHHQYPAYLLTTMHSEHAF
ncbi:hypothetical protein B0G83_13019 [Paraburkholderia sp. BL21I4N1]|nr:hypothetical protein B0G83_13019 [Paraburkholderia sp. BL21I4N1]